MSVQVMTIEQAQEWLKEHTYGRLRADYMDPIFGRRIATVVNGNSFAIVLTPRSKKHGYQLMWGNVVKIWREKTEEVNMTGKFIREARKASFSNSFIRDCLKADPSKSPCLNRLSTGVPIEGQLVSLERIDRMCWGFLEQWKKCWEEKRDGRWTFDFCGYDGSVELAWRDGEPYAWLNKEYRGCGNGYYYLLVNDKYFIGYDID